jgi:hypothetical protein
VTASLVTSTQPCAFNLTIQFHALRIKRYSRAFRAPPIIFLRRFPGKEAKSRRRRRRRLRLGGSGRGVARDKGPRGPRDAGRRPGNGAGRYHLRYPPHPPTKSRTAVPRMTRRLFFIPAPRAAGSGRLSFCPVRARELEAATRNEASSCTCRQAELEMKIPSGAFREAASFGPSASPIYFQCRGDFST